MSLCIFTSVTDEDAGWLDAYLAEVSRLGFPFAMHFDRCSAATVARVTNHDLFAGSTSQPDPNIEFTEQHKQRVFDLVAENGFEWALAVDVDEVFAANAGAVLRDLSNSLTADLFDFRWLNLWGDADHIRVDGPWCHGHRANLYNLRGGRKWFFDHPVTNGAKLVGRAANVVRSDELVCLHAGLMTPELRRSHKERWDRIYSKALRGDLNPYGLWKEAIETEGQAVTVRHGYR